MNKCPSLNSLVEFLTNQISQSERSQVETHLATGCPRCEEEHTSLAEILDLTSTDHSFEFSEETLARVIDQFKSHASPKPSLIERVRARLVFDSFTMQPAMGLRNTVTAEQTSSERQVLFNAGAYEVDLRFEVAEASEAGTFENLIGQVLCRRSFEAGTSFSVSLLAGERELAGTETNQQGIFSFTRIASGVYGIKVVVPGGEVYIDEVATARST